MKQHSLYFSSPRQVEITTQNLPDLPHDHVLVQTLLSAISPGTEGLIYRGQFPEGMQLDINIPALSGQFHYPVKYGYSTVGRVVELGRGVERTWQDRLVFAFHPHESCFAAAPRELHPLPEGVSIEDAVFLPNMETAVSLVMDGRPMVGEDVLVFGQGIIGLLTTALLAQYPLRSLVTMDRYPKRRQASQELGAQASFDPGAPASLQQASGLFQNGADLTYEVSGAPEALDQAISLTGFEGRVVIGSWYGQKRVNLELGGRFHRSRIRLLGSQVSTLSPELSGRWSKERRFLVAWKMLSKIKPARFITQRFPLHDASLAYELLDRSPKQTIQVVFTYT